MSSPSKGRPAGVSLLPQTPGTPSGGRSKSPTMPPSPTPSPRTRPTPRNTQPFVSTGNLSVPSTPYLTPHLSSANVGTTPKRLLMPTVRSVKLTYPRIPNSKPSPSRLGRNRAGSLSVAVVNEPQERTSVGASDWLPGGERFEVVEEQLELEGFQIYAVEKWYASQDGFLAYNSVVISSHQGLSRVSVASSC